jgi:hypothetical protein
VTPNDFCEKCTQIGEGNYDYKIDDVRTDPPEGWNEVEKSYPNFDGTNVLCKSYDPNPCTRSYKQCGGKDNEKQPPVEWTEKNGYDVSCPGSCDCVGDDPTQYKQCIPR